MTDAIRDRTETLPSTLLNRDQWICWREQERDGKPTKVPTDPSSGEFASTTDSDTWGDFEMATDALDRQDVNGLGFVFTDDDPIVGVDLDDCRDPETGEAKPIADEIIDRLDSYTEVSPSGTGYHVLLEGTLPAGGNRSGAVEMYETARFFTMTGDHVEGTPTELRDRSEALAAVHTEYVRDDGPDRREDDGDQSAPDAEASLADDEILERARAAANGDKFQRLWRGDTSGYESHSEADMALCCQLAFWTGGDHHQIDRLFRRSGLLRAKWDEVHYSDGSTYGERTIERAVRRTSEFYDPTAATDGAAQERWLDVDAADQSARPASADDGTETEALAARVAATETTVDHLEQRVQELETELGAVRDRLREERAAREELAEQVAGRQRGLRSWLRRALGRRFR